MLNNILEQADEQHKRAVKLMEGWTIEEQQRVLFYWMGVDTLKEMNDFLESKDQEVSV